MRLCERQRLKGIVQRTTDMVEYIACMRADVPYECTCSKRSVEHMHECPFVQQFTAASRMDSMRLGFRHIYIYVPCEGLCKAMVLQSANVTVGSSALLRVLATGSVREPVRADKDASVCLTNAAERGGRQAGERWLLCNSMGVRSGS